MHIKLAHGARLRRIEMRRHGDAVAQAQMLWQQDVDVFAHQGRRVIACECFHGGVGHEHVTPAVHPQNAIRGGVQDQLFALTLYPDALQWSAQ